MKKLLVVLLSLGLIVAFGATASAVDVKFSGGYYVVGVYDNNPEFQKSNGYSRAAFFQRIRVQMEFVVAEGLSMTGRFDALEKQWGNTDSRSMVWQDSTLSSRTDQDKTNSRVYATQGSAASSTTGLVSETGKPIQENIEFERAFITFKTALGQFDVGYQLADKWGTDFGDSESTRPRIKFTTQTGPFTFLAVYEKVFESDTSQVLPVAGLTTASPASATALSYAYRNLTDADADNYFLAGIYSFKGGQAGLLYKNVQNSMQRAYLLTAATAPFKTEVMALVPYFKVTVGPVYLEGEATYAFGKAAKFDSNTNLVSLDKESWNAYMKARVDMGPAYFGGQVGWVQGDGDNATKDTTGGDGGYDWKPTLILNNVDYATWLPNGKDSGLTNTYKNDPKGFLLYNIFGGVNPTPKLNMEAAISFVSYDTKKTWNTTRTAQTARVSADIGTEVDVTATYKIYDNLTYMVGAGYIFTGAAWKGTNPANEVGDNYMLLNKLTLSF